MIGLGNLGGPIGEQLAASGMTTTVYDAVPAATGPAVAAGAAASDSAARVAAASEVTLICVRTAEQAADVLRGEDSLLDGAKPGHVVGLISTVRPDAVAEFAALAAEHGVTLIDTPAAGTGASAVLEKDLRHAIELAAQNGVDLPGARFVRTVGDTIFQVTRAAGASSGDQPGPG